MPEQGAGRPGSHVLPRPGELNRSRPAAAVRLAPLPDDGPGRAGPSPGCGLPEYCGPGRAAARRAGGVVRGPAPEPRAERQAGVLVVGTPGIHQAAPWPAWGRPG